MTLKQEKPIRRLSTHHVKNMALIKLSFALVQHVTACKQRLRDAVCCPCIHNRQMQQRLKTMWDGHEDVSATGNSSSNRRQCETDMEYCHRQMQQQQQQQQQQKAMWDGHRLVSATGRCSSSNKRHGWTNMELCLQLANAVAASTAAEQQQQGVRH